MKAFKNKGNIVVLLFVVASIVLAACQPVQPVAVPDGPQMATAKVNAALSNEAGRAIVSARGNHFVVDSVPPLDGPNEELNPLDMMLGALATCGIFVAERAAGELELPLAGVSATVAGDLDPSGVAGADVNPRIQKVRVHMDADGVDDQEMGELVANFIQRCPIYTTISRSADIEITTGDETPSPATEGLATATVSATLSNQPGRAIVSARGNHFIIDSVPPLQGPNEERNPLDLMLGALATCGSFVYEKAAQEMEIPLDSLDVAVEGDFYPAGVAGADVNPRMRALRVNMKVAGPTAEQAELLAAEFASRCPIYTTLVRAAPIELTNSLN